MAKNTAFYSHSGKFTFKGLLLSLGIALGFSLPSAFLYGLVTAYLPIAFLKAICGTLVFLGVGFLSGFGAQRGHVRNVNLTFFVGLVAGILALYVSWVTWLHFMQGSSYFSSPSQILISIDSFIKDPHFFYNLKNSKIYGDSLKGVWQLEAAFLTLGVALTGAYFIYQASYCEKCQRWTEKREGCLYLEPIESPMARGRTVKGFKKAMKARDFSGLVIMKSLQNVSIAGAGKNYTQVDIDYCPQCQDLYLLSIKAVNFVKNSKGVEEKKETTVIDRIQIDYSLFHRLLTGMPAPKPSSNPLDSPEDQAP